MDGHILMFAALSVSAIYMPLQRFAVGFRQPLAPLRSCAQLQTRRGPDSMKGVPPDHFHGTLPMSCGDAEGQLLHEAIAGNRDALSQLLLSQYDDLRQFIAARISTELQGLLRPDDVLHSVLVQIAKSIETFEPRHPGAFGAWARKIAENLLKDADKRRRRERRWPNQAAAACGSSLPGVVERLPGDSTTPSDRVQRDDNARQLKAALANLPAEQREVLERYYLKDQSLEQIASGMDRSKDAIRGICYRARKNLRALMGRSSLYFSG